MVKKIVFTFTIVLIPVSIELLYQPSGDPLDPEFIFKHWKLSTLSKSGIIQEINTIINWLSYLVQYIEANYSNE